MNDTGIKPQVLNEIKEYAVKHNIAKVILFGSRARGDYYRASDIDLAVCGGDVTGFTLDVRENTSTLLEFDIVDLSQNLQEKFLASIHREWIVLYEKV